MSSTSSPTGPVDIVVLGNASIDLTAYLPHEIQEGETVIAKGFEMGLGGKGANQAVAAARAGGAVSYIGRIGTDAFGERILGGLQGENIDLTELEQVAGDTANATIWVQEDGANRIAVFLGVAADINPTRTSQAVSKYQGASYFVAQLELDQEVVAAGLTAAKAAGMTTLVNIAPYAPLHHDILANTDWLIANEVELAALLESIDIPAALDVPASELMTSLPQWVEVLGVNLIVTLGGEGAVGATMDDPPSFVDAPRVQAIDTVGAGDCFVGYFVASLSHGHAWADAMRAGVQAASESVTKPGAQASYPSAHTPAG